MKHQSAPRPSRSPRPSRGQGSNRDRVPLPRDLVPIVKAVRRIQEEEDVSEIQALIWRRLQEKLRRAEDPSEHRHDGARRHQAHARESPAAPQDGVVAGASIGVGSTLEGDDDDPETQRSPVAVTRMADLFDVVVREDVPFITRQIRRFGVPSSDVEDITQEVLCAVCKSRSHYDPLGGKRQTWLYRVAFYRCTTYLKSARYRRETLAGTHLGNVLASMVQRGDPEKVAIANEERQLVWESIERIALYQRAVFIMHEIEEWTMEEIAHTLDIPKSTCWGRLQRARQEFRTAVLRWLRVRKASMGR